MFKLLMKSGLLLLAALAAGVLWQKAQLSVLALSRIDPVPETRTLVDAGHYAEAADYLGFFMGYDYVSQDPAARALDQEIEQVRDSAEYRARQIREGLLDGTSDENLGKAVGIATDMLVIGDLRDLTKQGLNWSQDQEVDEVLVALSAIGLAATAAQIATAGAATPVKGGVIALKIARKSGKIPAWLGKSMIDGAATVKRTGKLDAVSKPLGDVYRLAKVPGGLTLLSHTRDLASLSRMAQLAETFGKQTATLYRIGGEAALKAGARAGELGVETVKLAATYGQAGLKVLDRVGATAFMKYAARSTKVVYKGDVFQLIARLLIQLPDWLLALFVALGMAVWVPWQSMKKLSGRLGLAINPMPARRNAP